MREVALEQGASPRCRGGLDTGAGRPRESASTLSGQRDDTVIEPPDQTLGAWLPVRELR